MLAILPLLISTAVVFAEDKCAKEFNADISCLREGFTVSRKSLTESELDKVGKKIQACFKTSKCTPPDYEAKFSDYIPTKYQEAVQLFVDTVDSFPPQFQQCVLRRSREIVMASVQNCVRNITESLKDFEYPDLTGPPLPVDDKEKKQLVDLANAHIHTVLALDQCNKDKGNASAGAVGKCIADATQDKQDYVCKLQTTCRANLTNTDKRECSSRMDQACAATIHCLEREHQKSFLEHIVDSLKYQAGDASGSSSSSAKAKGKAAVSGLVTDLIAPCEKQTGFSVPKKQVAKIFTKLPKGPPPPEVVNFLRIFIDARQDDLVNPCEACTQFVGGGQNATATTEAPAATTAEEKPKSKGKKGR